MSYSMSMSSVRLWTPAGARRLFRRLSGSVRLMLERSRERQILAALNARELRDIGVARYDAALEAQRWFWMS
jgi:uncharacterized protein YjiS (DUF1127 family)